jgi:hypothetical protein
VLSIAIDAEVNSSFFKTYDRCFDHFMIRNGALNIANDFLFLKSTLLTTSGLPLIAPVHLHHAFGDIPRHH